MRLTFFGKEIGLLTVSLIVIVGFFARAFKSPFRIAHCSVAHIGSTLHDEYNAVCRPSGIST
jgi:hypothetical protein